MIKLLIADDEQIIRETISTSIDWAALGVKVIGLAANGIEAYNTILDEYPEIVLTDIKMPGLTGLELIDRIKKINSDTEFIILSGYGDFEYAREAMRYGVKQYLLKPCNENQIIQSVQETIQDLIPKRLFKKGDDQDFLMRNFESNVIWSIINGGFSLDQGSVHTASFSGIYQPYSRYLDFNDETYDLCFLYFVEYAALTETVEQIKALRNALCPNVVFTFLYVHNTLLFFYKSFGVDNVCLDSSIRTLTAPIRAAAFQYERSSFDNLKSLLDVLITKIRRYETIHYSIDGSSFVHICNYQNILRELDACMLQFKKGDKQSIENAFLWLERLIEPITDLNLLNQIASFSITQLAVYYSPTSIIATSEKLLQLSHLGACAPLRRELLAYLQEILKVHLLNSLQMTISDQIKKAVSDHLEDPNLSLKWIAENSLYMNVDYLSRKFVTETGEKFSTYLMQQRISRSKILLHQYNSVDQIKRVTELVGCGNNPQYFYQIFKRETGMTPIKYIKSIQGDSSNDK